MGKNAQSTLEQEREARILGTLPWQREMKKN